MSLDSWQAWSPAEVGERLGGLSAPWYVAAGWALDLFLGRQTREHDDLEIGVPADRFAAAARGASRLGVRRHRRRQAVADDGRPPFSTHHQTWVRERDGGPWRVDVMREPWDGDTWIFRRDPRIRLSTAGLVARTPDGIPYAQPEVVLLFKAKATRPKDDLDFETVLPHLDVDRRTWLRDALELVHPGHRWLGALAT